MSIQIVQHLTNGIWGIVLGISMISYPLGMCAEGKDADVLEKIQLNRDNPTALA